MDNTYRTSQTGGARRDWRFSTRPLPRATADTYEATLRTVAAQMCSGDLLGTPLMACTEITGWTPIHISGSHYVVLDFMLHEVQPAKVLLRYAPGDLIAGESFSRSTVGYQLNGNISNPLTQIAINAKRDTHYINSVRSILLEAGSTDNFLWSNDISNAAWTKTNCTVGTGIADPLGGTTACTLTATATNGGIFQLLSAGSSIIRANSVWVRRRTGTGTINLYDQAGANPVALSLTTNWLPFSKISGSASTTRRFDIIIATSGDAIDVWDARQDDNAFPTSEILTTSAPVARGADSYSLPFTAPPGEMTVYAKFVEKGTSLLSAHIFSITNAASASPIFMGLTSGGFYFANHINAANVSSPVAVAALNDVVELVFRLFGDGSVDIVKSVNGGAAVSGAQSAATPIAAAWAGQLLWLNASGNTTSGFIALQSFKVVAGSRSLTELRAL